MSLFNYFRKDKSKSASVARERLQVIVAHERLQRDKPDYLEKLREELIEVIRKHTKIDKSDINIQLENNGDCSVLELNVTLPEHKS